MKIHAALASLCLVGLPARLSIELAVDSSPTPVATPLEVEPRLRSALETLIDSGTGEPAGARLRAPIAGDLLELREISRRLVRDRLRSRRGFDLASSGPLEIAWVEYLARRLPADAGLSRRDWRADVEATWCFTEGLRGLDWAAILSIANDPRRDAALLAAVAWIHDRVELSLAGGGALRPHAITPEPLSPVGHLSFEQNWRVTLHQRPSSRGGYPLAPPIHIAFTSNTEGRLARCACNFSKGGGMGRIAHEIGVLRDGHPELVLVDLGNFTALEARLEGASLEAERDVQGRIQSLLGYDALSVGPDELYGGILHRGPESALVHGAPLVGQLEIDGARPLPAWLRIDRGGRRIAFVGLCDWVALGYSRDAHEANAKGAMLQPLDSGLEERLRALREHVDLIVVGGQLTPRTLRRLSRARLADVILVDERGRPEFEGGRQAGFLGDALVARGSLGASGVHWLELILTESDRVMAYRFRNRRTGAHDAVDPNVTALLRDLAPPAGDPVAQAR